MLSPQYHDSSLKIHWMAVQQLTDQNPCIILKMRKYSGLTVLSFGAVIAWLYTGDLSFDHF